MRGDQCVVLRCGVIDLTGDYCVVIGGGVWRFVVVHWGVLLRVGMRCDWWFVMVRGVVG